MGVNSEEGGLSQYLYTEIFFSPPPHEYLQILQQESENQKSLSLFIRPWKNLLSFLTKLREWNETKL